MLQALIVKRPEWLTQPAVADGITVGWVPVDAFLHAASLRTRVGEVNARGAGLKDLGCYEVKTTFDPQLDKYKVVKGARSQGLGDLQRHGHASHGARKS